KTKLMYAILLSSSATLVACGGSSSSGGSKNSGGDVSTFDSEVGATFAVMMAQGFMGMADDEVEGLQERAEPEGRSATKIMPRSSGMACDSGSHKIESGIANFTLDGANHPVNTEVDTYDDCIIEIKDSGGDLLLKARLDGRIEQGESSDGYFYTKATGVNNNLTEGYLVGEYDSPGLPDYSGKNISENRIIQYGKKSNGGIIHESYADMRIDVPEVLFTLKMGRSESEKLRLEVEKEDEYELVFLDGYLFTKLGTNCILSATFETTEPLKQIISNDDEDGDVVAGAITVEMEDGDTYHIQYHDGVPYVNGSVPTQKQMEEAAAAMQHCESNR